MRSFISRQYRVAVCLAHLFAFVCMTAPATHAQQPDLKDLDVIKFRDGDRISGHLKSANSGRVLFAGKVTGEIQFSWADIAEIDLPNRQIKLFSTTNTEGSVITVSVIAFYDSGLHLRKGGSSLNDLPINDLTTLSVVEADVPSTALAESVAVGTVAPVTPSAPPTTTAVFGPVGGQFKISPDSIVRATQKQINLAGAFDLGFATTSQKAFRHQEASLATEANYTDSRKPGASAVVTALYSGTLQQNVYLRDAKLVCPTCPNPGASDGVFLYGIANGYHNLSLGMNVAQSYGGGVGWQGDSKHASYSLMGDIRYFKENLYTPGISLSGAEAGLSEQYSYTFPWPASTTGVNVYQRILFLPVFGNARAFQVRGSAGVDVPINANFSLDVDVLDDYLRNAPAGSLQNYDKIIFSLKYTIVPKAPKIP